MSKFFNILFMYSKIGPQKELDTFSLVFGTIYFIGEGKLKKKSNTLLGSSDSIMLIVLFYYYMGTLRVLPCRDLQRLSDSNSQRSYYNNIIKRWLDQACLTTWLCDIIFFQHRLLYNYMNVSCALRPFPESTKAQNERPSQREALLLTWWWWRLWSVQPFSSFSSSKLLGRISSSRQ